MLRSLSAACSSPLIRSESIDDERKEKANQESEINDLKQISPIAWQHINFLGRYEFEKLDIPIKIDKIVDQINYQSSKSEN